MHISAHISAMGRTAGGPRRARYGPPTEVRRVALTDLLRETGRTIASQEGRRSQFELLHSPGSSEAYVYCVGDAAILSRPTVSIVGTREVSNEGWQRASRIAKELVAHRVVVMSGLARGVDTAALSAALQAQGQVVGIIGTPVSKAYPAENAPLQEEIYSRHLLISPFAENERVSKGNFPKRNRVMALLSDATVIVEASDTSGTLHQAAECQRQGRWLFILKSVADNPSLTWPARFVGKDKVRVVENITDIMDAITP